MTFCRDYRENQEFLSQLDIDILLLDPNSMDHAFIVKEGGVYKILPAHDAIRESSLYLYNIRNENVYINSEEFFKEHYDTILELWPECFI